MKNLHVAALATLFGISAASGIALTQAQHPANSAGIFASTALIAAADQDNRGNGKAGKNKNKNGQCNTNGNTGRGNGDQNDQGNQGSGHGQKRGWQNPNNPHYCGSNNGNCGYTNNGQYNGQNNGQCNSNGQGNTNGQGNSTIRGTITSVNGNQVSVMEGFGQTVTINDQPALNNQSTGRVVIGRYVTAYGYYQNGIFYATSMQ